MPTPFLPTRRFLPPAHLRPVARARRRLLAATRLSLAAVCAESAGLGPYDYHSHRDDADGAPWHVEGGRRCRRCGKRFRT
jgi:hypothetical protein